MRLNIVKFDDGKEIKKVFFSALLPKFSSKIQFFFLPSSSIFLFYACVHSIYIILSFFFAQVTTYNFVHEDNNNEKKGKLVNMFILSLLFFFFYSHSKMGDEIQKCSRIYVS